MGSPGKRRIGTGLDQAWFFFRSKNGPCGNRGHRIRSLRKAPRRLTNAPMREEIRSELKAIEPLDALEHEHLADALAWVDSGAEIFRVAKPATPPKHLVSY